MTVQHKNLADSELHELKGAASATAGQIPISDGGGTSPFSNPNHFNYGCLTLSGNATATTLTGGGTYDELDEPTWTETAVNLVTSGGTPKHYLEATNGGVYLVSVDLTIVPASATTQELGVRIMVDGTETGAIASLQTSATTPYSVSLTQVMSLTALEDVSVAIANKTNTNNVTVQDASLTMFMLKQA